MALLCTICISYHSVFTIASSLPSINDLPDLSYTIDSVEFTEMEVYDALIPLDPNKASVLMVFHPEYYYHVPKLSSNHSIICLPFH